MNERKAIWILISVALVRGASNTLMKLGVGELTPLSLVSLRFGIAFLVMLVIFRAKVFQIDRNGIVQSLWMGALLVLTFGFLMYGLKTTEASTASFLTGISVVVVPILNLLLFRDRPKKQVWAAMVVAVLGIALLSLKDGLSIQPGAILCILGAMFNAIYIVTTSRFSAHSDPLLLGIWQLFWAGIIAGIGTLFFGGFTMPSSPMGWTVVLGLALLCSAYGYVLQPVAQKYTDANKAGFILASEPAFSLVFAFAILHELFSFKEGVGALLVFLSILIVSGSGKYVPQKVTEK